MKFRPNIFQRSLKDYRGENQMKMSIQPAFLHVTRVKLLAFMLGFSITMSSCSLFFPANQTVFKSESTRVIGQLNWNIVECDTGSILAQGNNPITAKDITIIEVTNSKGTWYSKQITLERGFFLDIIQGPQNNENGMTGIGLSGGYENEPVFSFEWFDVIEAGHAIKRQESGCLEFTTARVSSRIEIARTEFSSDVSLRLQRKNFSSLFRSKRDWRINILAHSYVIWPSVLDGSVITHEDNE